MINAKKACRRFHKRTAVIGVVGLGYVGLPLALRFSTAGFRVIGFDIDPAKVRGLARGKSYLSTVPDEEVAVALKGGLKVTTDFARAKQVDALLICVPTPLDLHREPDLSYVTNTVRSLLPHIRKGQLLSLESTTWPGTTEEILKPLLESTGFRVGRDVFLAFSPERQDPGNAKFGAQNIPKLVGGSTRACRDVAMACYGAAIDRVVPVSSTQVAEMAKLLENIHRAVNIGLVNELKIVADRMNIDIREVIDAAATKPFGFVPYYPGPGLGGHCIPVDPFYLTWKAREYGVHTRFIELAGEINSQMPDWVIHKLAQALNQRGRSVKGARVLILGIAYKKNVDDMRESPAIEILHKLQGAGARVSYSDPYIPVIPRLRRGEFRLSSQTLSANSLKRYDAVLLVTDHDAFDYPFILKHARLIVDTRGVYRRRHSRVVRA